MRLVLALASLALLLCAPIAHADSPKTTDAAVDARTTGAFHGLSITTVIEVELTVGAATKVELRGPKAWLPRIDTTVKDGVLTVSMPGRWNKLPRLKAIITTPKLDLLSISGVVTVAATGLAGTSFDLSVSGVGDLDLAGSVDTLHVGISGTAQLRAKGLTTKTTSFAIDGSAEAVVHASKKLDASIAGVGAITVYGKPATVTKRITGTGTIDLE